MDIHSLVFMGESRIPWLYQKHKYAPVKKALDFLKQNKIGEKFYGALEIGREDFENFSEHLFWLVRCNASLPYFHFLDSEQKILGYFCKYGNIHIGILKKNADSKFREAIRLSGFSLLKTQPCHEPFSKSGGIKNRQIVV